MLFIQFVEAAGAGILGGAIVGMILAGVLLYRGEAVLGVAGIALVVGLVCGIVFRLVRRPRLLATLIDADRQLGLHDLISTAWAIRHQSDDPFAVAVLAEAEQRLANLSTSSVVLGRLGRRGWGGAVLTTALLLTMGLVSNNPVDTQASAAVNPMALRNAQRRVAMNERRLGMSTANATEAEPFLPDYPGGHNDNRDPMANTAAMKIAGNSADGNDGNETADPSGTGGGSAKSNNSKTGGNLNPTGSNARGHENGAAAGGVGSAGNAGGKRGSSGAAAGDSATNAGDAPWQSDSWLDAQAAAERAIRSGAVPAGYEEIVREYFRR